MTHTLTIPIGPTQGPKAGVRGWLALAVLMLPVLLVSVDNTVLSFALPVISTDLQPSAIGQLWIVDAYALVLASLLVTMGSLGDRFGRRRMLLIGATGFGAVSVLAAFAPTAPVLIGCRALLGVFGAMLMPSTLSLLRSVFTNRNQRRLAIAVWASAFSAGSALGPIVGGALLENFAWGSIFLMAVPVLIPLLILAPILVPESRDPQPGPVDGWSILLSLATMVPIVYAIKEIAVHGFGGIAAALLAAGLSFGIIFVRRQRTLRTPMLDMALFRHGSFSGAILVNLLSIMALVGFLYFVAQQLQLVSGLSPLQSGVALVPGLVAMIVAGLVVVPIARAVRPSVLIPSALVFSVVGYVMVSISAVDASVWMLVVAFVSLGIGVGMAETVSNELILATAPPEKAGAASAVSETAYEVGAVLGTTVLGGILTAIYRGTLDLPSELSTDSAYTARETLAGAVSVADQSPEPLGGQVFDAAAAAFESGVAVTALIGAALVILAGVVAATTLRKTDASTGG